MVGIIALAAFQHSAIMPTVRNEGWWQTRHRACVEQTRAAQFDVAFIGDSITQGWETDGKAAWDQHFAPLRAANFGFSGDRTQHVLWRLQNREIIGGRPKVVVVMIGTNNLGDNTPAETADGVVEIVNTLLARTNARVLLLGIFPRANNPENRFRVAAAEATTLFWNRVEHPRLTKLNIGSHFLRSDGSLRTMLMPDLLHLNENGYSIWAKAIVPTVKKLLAKN
jgi:beta-glucosidase